LDATAQAELVRRGDVSSRDLVELALERIARLDVELGSVVHLDRDGALARAGEALEGPFAGVPFLAKDLLAMPGMRCAMGSRLFAGHVPAQPTPYTQAIDDAGLVTIGKTSTSELGLLGSTETQLEGTTHNPWSPRHSAGGSSGGSVAAVAAGLVPFAHASDGGGSIRGPASLCGLFGFMPSRGRTVPAMPPSELPELVIDHCVSRSVRDSARFLAATERREHAVHPPIGMVEAPLSAPLRIGVVRKTVLGADAPADGEAAVNRAVALCGELGHHLEEAAFPPCEPSASEAFFVISGAGVTMLFDMVTPMLGRPVTESDVEPYTWELASWYRSLPADALSRAREQLSENGARMAAFMKEWDAVLSPTLGVPNPELGFMAPSLPREVLFRRIEGIAGFTAPPTMLGAPAMSVPLFWNDAELPVGCHFAAAPGQDARLLGLAYQLEAAAPWAERWPAFAEA
jgi:amidase